MKKQKNKEFKFDSANQKKIEKILAQYPADRKRSAILPLLDLAQRQNNGWLSIDAIELVAKIIELPAIKVIEVASFYSMFNLKKIGKFHIQICGTTPCWLRGAGEITKICKKKLSIELGQTTDSGLFTLTEVECLGACVNAPVAQINDDYYENLTTAKIEMIIENIILESNSSNIKKSK
ncbi:MAG: NADH-quinone oxidoreductase subunit NuoE [Rickettsiaceae bacterium]|nr:NADH-quinone oxidoreductase subunit NuoE [Rickettsiaceae bacterium]